MNTRIMILLLSILTILIPGLASSQVIDEGPERVIDLELQEKSRLAVERGLQYLKRTQNTDGSWTDKIGRKVHYEYRGRMGKHVGVTALACIAFLAEGSLPGRGKYGEQVEKGLDFILKNVQTNGFITCSDRRYSRASSCNRARRSAVCASATNDNTINGNRMRARLIHKGISCLLLIRIRLQGFAEPALPPALPDLFLYESTLRSFESWSACHPTPGDR